MKGVSSGRQADAWKEEDVRPTAGICWVVICVTRGGELCALCGEVSLGGSRLEITGVESVGRLSSSCRWEAKWKLGRPAASEKSASPADVSIGVRPISRLCSRPA